MSRAALYLLEPAEPGAAWAPFAGVRPIAELRAGAWRVRERWEAACRLEATAILGDARRAASTKATSRRVRPPAPVDGPAVVGASWFAPAGAGSRICTRRRRAPIAPWRRARSAGSCRRAERGTGRTSAATAAEIDGLRPARRVRPGHRAGAVPRRGLRRPPRRARHRRARGQPRAGRPGRRDRASARRSSRASSSTCATARSCSSRASRSGTAPGSRARSTPARARKLLGGFIRASVFGPECRVRGEIAASVFLGYANKSHDGFVGHSVRGPLGEPGRADHHVQSQEHLRRGPARDRRPPHRDRPPEPRHPLRRPRQDRDRHHAGDRHRRVGAGASVFGPAAPPKYVPPFAWGGEGAERLTADGFLRVAERVMAAPQRGVDRRSGGARSSRPTAAGPRRMMHALRAGLGLARELLRGRGGGRGPAARRRVQRAGDRAAGRVAGLALGRVAGDRR